MIIYLIYIQLYSCFEQVQRIRIEFLFSEIIKQTPTGSIRKKRSDKIRLLIRNSWIIEICNAHFIYKHLYATEPQST